MTLDSTGTGQHYASLTELPLDTQKYWHQRYSIFSKYDEGVWMTEDSWFEVTPEPVARKIAQNITQTVSPDKEIVVDCFAGVGGNAIAFAQSERWKRVYAVERDPRALACAKHNAKIYGVHDKISWHLGDCFEIFEDHLQGILKYAILFVSPPWGGPGYRSKPVFDLMKMQPYNLSQLLDPLRKYSDSVALYLPRTSDLKQLAQYSAIDKKIAVVHYCMEGASKALCAYFGDFRFD